jgi:hypothetical protein
MQANYPAETEQPVRDANLSIVQPVAAARQTPTLMATRDRLGRADPWA